MKDNVNKVYKKIIKLIDSSSYNPDISLIYSSMDVTDLSSASTEKNIEELCMGIIADASLFSYPAAVCFYPSKLDAAFKILKDTPVKIATVAAGFPHGQVGLQTKVFEIKELIDRGVDEIDIVLNVPHAIQGDLDKITKELMAIKSNMKNAKLKVILEVSILNSIDLVYKVSQMCLNAGVDCIKTSTGKEGSLATPEAAITMCMAIQEYYERSGQKRTMKVAGGISDIPTASLYVEIVREVLGQEWLNPDLFRIGASRLRTTIIESLK